MRASDTKEYDVIIVGGGPAGASAGVHLALRGARVLLVEREKFPRAKLCGEFISPECLGHFARLGVLAEMVGAGAARVAETQFYARSGRQVGVPSAWFGREGSGVESRALGLSRAEMDARLLARARAVGVEILEETQVVGLSEGEGRVRGVYVQSKGTEREYKACVTIDATGRTRALARRVEEKAKKRGGHEATINSTLKTRMPLVAFKAHLENARGAEGVCEIYFYRGGYGGLSRVEGGLSNLCFIVTAGDVRARGSDAGRVMREIVMSNRRAAETLKSAHVRSEWLAVALESFGRRELIPAIGLLTVGDAASFIDPFTGSGMLMALESGEVVSQAIMRALPDLRAGNAFASLAEDYRARYHEHFAARLRVCTLLRRAAFAPQFATEAGIVALGASKHLRRVLARATRPA